MDENNFPGLLVQVEGPDRDDSDCIPRPWGCMEGDNEMVRMNRMKRGERKENEERAEPRDRIGGDCRVVGG